MAKAEAKVGELVERIERGEIRLPEMQRRYVWKATRVRDLFDSLYRDYPSGIILLWETDEDVATREMAVGQRNSGFGSNLLLLDGQQRLTSLSAILRGEPLSVRGRKRPIELLFNLDHPDDLEVVTEVEDDDDDVLPEPDETSSEEEESLGQGQEENSESNEDEILKVLNKMTFVVMTKKLASLPNWVRVSEVFREESNGPFLTKAGLKDFDDPRYDKYSTRLAKLRAIRNYVYRMDILEKQMSYDEVTEIFVRVNSLGAKLRSSDLALAQITAKWRSSLHEFQTFRDKIEKSGFDYDVGLYLRAMVVFATGQSRFKSVQGLSLETIKSSWSKSCEGVEFSLDFLSSNLGISSPALLASPFLIISLARYFSEKNYKLNEKEEAEIRRWALLANAKGRYSRGSSETILDQDIATIRSGGSVNDLLDRLETQVGRLSIEAGDMAGRNQRSALFKAMFLAFKTDGAKDWRSGLEIDVSHRGMKHRLQFHHIFPKAVLVKKYSNREINDIANLSFIGGHTNRKISQKAPEIYFQKVLDETGKSAFTKQCIPLDPELLKVENYLEFLDARRQLMVDRLNEFMS